ncbi:hypothetical protein Clacol_006076 [Clathrus columnatus]|uniref:DUF6699 domain-containing protein n=1 Tax=Clathrus columnatus TaxID=1419009 RepID=A0AAV5AE96_9AGAM|nr:hypothetical protein Clacol_006076 [Clathrus columnatus]
MDVVGGKWMVGEDYGPVLSRTDLYLLQQELELHPVLKGLPNFVFNVTTGEAKILNAAQQEEPFDSQKDEPASIPRVTELIIISKVSPWCVTVFNENGVTLENVLGCIFEEYAKRITDLELSKIPSNVQHQIRRTAALYRSPVAGAWGPQSIDSPLKRSGTLYFPC